MQLSQWTAEEVDDKLQTDHAAHPRDGAPGGGGVRVARQLRRSAPTPPGSSRWPTPCSTRARCEMTDHRRTTRRRTAPAEAPVDKGLKSDALGLVSNIVIGVASTAPAYSLAATLGLIIVAVGVLSPTIVVLAFVPMLFVSIGYSELNKADPDCGTTFTWGTRTFGPWLGWLGGWGIIAVRRAGHGQPGPGDRPVRLPALQRPRDRHNPTSEWVLLVGVLFIVLLTYVCYRGIELSARVQRILLSVEVLILVVFAVVALVRVAIGQRAGRPPGPVAGAGSTRSTSLLLQGRRPGCCSCSSSTGGGTRRSRSTRRPRTGPATPDSAAIISTVLLLVIYFVVTLAAQSFAGVGRRASAWPTPPTTSDIFSGLGTAVFGHAWFGSVFAHLLILMVLTSAAASTQTTILPTARTTLSMAVYQRHPRRLRPDAQALPDADRLDRDHGRRLGRPLHRLQPPRRRQPHPRRGDGDRHLDRLLLRPHRVHLRLVLPQGAPPQPAGPVDEGHPPLARGTDALLRHGVEPLGRLELQQRLRPELHVVAPALPPALGRGRRVPHRPGLGGGGRRGHGAVALRAARRSSAARRSTGRPRRWFRRTRPPRRWALKRDGSRDAQALERRVPCRLDRAARVDRCRGGPGSLVGREPPSHRGRRIGGIAAARQASGDPALDQVQRCHAAQLVQVGNGLRGEGPHLARANGDRRRWRRPRRSRRWTGTPRRAARARRRWPR